jgi:CRISPR-associated protein Cmr3
VWLFLEALDVWMFRDGKPFNAGESHIANSLFPPSALTLQGALRTFLLDQAGVDLNAYREGKSKADVYVALGDPSNSGNPLGQFSFYGPFVAKRYASDQIERYVPLPYDVVAAKDADLRFRNTRLKTLFPIDAIMVVEDLSLHALNIVPDDKPLSSYWISEGSLQRYLDGTTLTVGDCVREETLFAREYRSGNALLYSHRRVRAEEGMLYSGAFIRPQADVGLLIWLSEDIARLLPDEGCFRLGGEGRMARFQLIEDAAQVQPNTPLVHHWRGEARLKVVFLTPTYFRQGWLPDDTAFQSSLVAAALGRPTLMGGWDLAQKRPRPVRRWVPAGSVYYFEFKGQERPDNLLLCEQPDRELPVAQLGFGQVAVGIW